MKLLLATDVFPPRCGGSGWSTYHLARALRARGHSVYIVRAALDPRRAAPYVYDDFVVHQIAVPVPPLPVVRNLAKNELFWALAGRRLTGLASEWAVDLIHGQHVMTIPAAVRAGQRLGRPTVATIRDYWATCPISTRLRPDGICQGCTPDRLTECLANHRPERYRLVRPIQGYVEQNRRQRQAALRAASAVVAVSAYVATDLAHHAAIDASVIPNLIDLPDPLPPPPDAAPGDWPYVLFVGKLDQHKGADLAPAIAQAAGRPLRLVVIGDGPLRPAIVAASEQAGLPLQLFPERPNSEVLRWLAHARALLFPARWPEPLSRVLLEAASVGCPILATPTGGTADTLVAGQSGWLAADPLALAEPLRRLIDEPAVYQHARQTGRALARERFATPVVVARYEQLYERLVAAR